MIDQIHLFPISVIVPLILCTIAGFASDEAAQKYYLKEIAMAVSLGLFMVMTYIIGTTSQVKFITEYEYEIDDVKLSSLQYTDYNKTSGLFILGIGWAESIKEESYSCYVKDINGEYEIKHFGVTSNKLRLDDSVEPKRVIRYAHRVKTPIYSFIKGETEETYLRSILIVPTNVFKVKYDANIN